MDFQSKLAEYAELIVKVGLNVKPGQTVFASSPVECAELTRLCVAECYKAGAREVVMQWSDDFVARETYLNADNAVFDEFHSWQEALFNGMADISAARLNIIGNDPENLRGIDPSRIQRRQRTGGKKLERYYNAMTTNQFQWCIAAGSTPAWAMKVFPSAENPSGAVDMLWEAIFGTVRVKGDGGAVDRWREHTAIMGRRVKTLNDYAFKSMTFRNSLGTNLVARLPEGHYWAGGHETAATGQAFIANLPTEEVFTAPLRSGVDGVVYASKPLVLAGNIIDGIRFYLKGGKIIDASAKTGERYLLDMLEVDEGARYLGEVALVPYDSPISNSGVLFYDTLFDENASCHLAFGEAYPCIVGSDKLTADERLELGLNKSYVHEDFMIGTSDFSIVGTTPDGNEIPVFVDGNFAF